VKTGPIASFTTCAPLSSLAMDALILLDKFSDLAASAKSTSTSALSSANCVSRPLDIVLLEMGSRGFGVPMSFAPVDEEEEEFLKSSGSMNP